jgi:hypothetical protein
MDHNALQRALGGLRGWPFAIVTGQGVGDR